MEEKKSKEVKMDVVRNEAQAEQPQKLTYEELNQACMELSQQNQQMQQYIKKLHGQLQEMTGMLQTKRMDYLFKVVELTCNYHDKAPLFDVPMFERKFVGDCVAEIQQSLTVPQEEGQDNTDNKE